MEAVPALKGWSAILFHLPGLNLSSEIFISNNIPYFERIRFTLIYGYKLNEYLEMQTGIIRQLDYKLIDETGKTFFCFGLYLSFNNILNKLQTLNSEMNDN